MKTFAVAFISFYDNELVIQFIKAETFHKAIMKYSSETWDMFDGFDDEEKETLEKWKEHAFNSDAMIDAREVSE